MRAVVQRVTEAAVEVEGEVVGRIGRGLLVLLGVGEGDDDRDAAVMATKIAGLRIFADAEQKMNRSIVDVGGSVLVVSQFTLLADVRRGRRPAFTAAADPADATRLVDVVANLIAAEGVPVETGRFGARMAVSLVNDGPVTIPIDVVDGKVRTSTGT